MCNIYSSELQTKGPRKDLLLHWCRKKTMGDKHTYITPCFDIWEDNIIIFCLLPYYVFDCVFLMVVKTYM